MQVENDKSFEPAIVRPFGPRALSRAQSLVSSMRAVRELRGIPYNENPEVPRCNRWGLHDPEPFVEMHGSSALLKVAQKIFKRALKPSYCFLSLYGSDGVLPAHCDRPPCRYSVDWLVSCDGVWPIYVQGRPFRLLPGDALCFPGVAQSHFRKPIREDGTATYCDIVLFHFVPIEWQGELK